MPYLSKSKDVSQMASWNLSWQQNTVPGSQSSCRGGTDRYFRGQPRHVNKYLVSATKSHMRPAWEGSHEASHHTSDTPPNRHRHVQEYEVTRSTLLDFSGVPTVYEAQHKAELVRNSDITKSPTVMHHLGSPRD